MNNKRKSILEKINQGGSMLVEAMAMLALISLVTPTLYKKSAERTSELQDINTATHVRTLAKAVDSYVSTNYQKLMKDSLNVTDAVHQIPLSDLESYLPYGYEFNRLKNFGTPKVALRRQGDTNSVTAFVQFPKKTAIGETRAARIASMVGSNGGYINRNNEAKGVGGVWSMSEEEIGKLYFDKSSGSIVVASSEAINSANSDAFENEMYLQRTQPENEEEKWRNSMKTDLYMGGVAENVDMHKILGVKQMIVGSTDPENAADLIISKDAENKGSIWLAGNLSAVNDLFRLETVGESDAELDFDGIIGATTQGAGKVDFIEGKISFEGGEGENKGKAKFDVDTTVEEKFDAKGDTSVASNSGAIFKAGPDGGYITADAKQVNLLAGNILTTTNGEAKNTKIGTSLEVSNKTHLQGATYIGAKTGEKNPQFMSKDEAMLNVQGNAFVSGKLEAGELNTPTIKTYELQAGGAEGHENYWLKANEHGVKVANINDPMDVRLEINDEGETALYGEGGLTKVELGNTNALVQGHNYVDIYTGSDFGTVSLQDGAIRLDKKFGGNYANEVQLNAIDTFVTTKQFHVAEEYESGSSSPLYIRTVYEDSDIRLNANQITINSERHDDTNGELTIKGNDILAVSPEAVEHTDGIPAARVEMDKKGFRVTQPDENVVLLNVDTSNYETSYKDDGSVVDDSSVYIRRGAIELERSGAKFSPLHGAADEGIGYIEASRFVSNAADPDGGIAEPEYAGDYQLTSYGIEPEKLYDKYMVNPAYTSVMHDIKLTTRGGARLSDILPDFINKGIYVVTNTYQDDININEIEVELNDGQLVAKNATSLAEENSAEGRWASAFLGVVPAPQCPPGHAKVITITPAGFQMAQAGKFNVESAYNPFNDGKIENRFLMLPGNGQKENSLGKIVNMPEDRTVNYLGKMEAELSSDPNTPNTIYYLGWNNPESEDCTTEDGTDDACNPEPLYFQQSTWLRSKVIPQTFGKKGDCSLGTNGQVQACTGENFAGWSAIMGFVYPGQQYGDIITKLMGGNASEYNADNYYWNVFPVVTGTLEAYATVYCYFDRNNIFGSGNNGMYVDQYDQLNQYRTGYSKDGSTVNYPNGVSGDKDISDNNSYIERLNDPTLRYTDPW